MWCSGFEGGQETGDPAIRKFIVNRDPLNTELWRSVIQRVVDTEKRKLGPLTRDIFPKEMALPQHLLDGQETAKRRLSRPADRSKLSGEVRSRSFSSCVPSWAGLPAFTPHGDLTTRTCKHSTQPISGLCRLWRSEWLYLSWSPMRVLLFPLFTE